VTLKSLKSSVLACLFIFTSGAAAQSPLIDVQFSGGGPTATGPAATGAAGDDWNYIAATGPTSAIVNVTGASTSLTVTLGGTGGFFSYPSSSNPVNANLEDGYYDNNPVATFTISGLTANALYNLWVISGTDPGAAPGASARPSTIVANGVSLSNAGVTESGYVNGGNFVEFVSLAADSTGAITVTATSTIGGEVDLNGFQLQSLPPASISFIGSDPGDNSWRTPSVPKPLDPDGDNIYGTAGYDVFDSSARTLLHAPAGVTITRLAPNVFPGNSGYTLIDNPSGGATITSGVAYFNPVSTGQVLNYASVTFTTAANYVIGIYTDNADFPGISPSALRIYQTNGSGDSGLISNTPGRAGDWYLFNVSANAGDVLNIQGIAVSNPSGSSGIGIITFDSGLASTLPGITTTSLPGGTVGTAYSQTLAATGGISPYQNWTVVSGSLPTGLTLNAATGVIGGTPTSATGSPFSFSVTVQDSASNTSTPQSLSIAILGLAQTITFTPLSNVTLGVPPFSVSARASSGLTVSFTSSTPSVCMVSGTTVTVSGAGTCSIVASQAGNGSYNPAVPVTQSFVVVYPPLAITTSALPAGHVGQSYSVTLSATGGSSNYTWSTGSTLPSGIILSASGVISGTATAPFNGTIGITVTDTMTGQTAAISLSLSITALPIVISGSGSLGDVALGASIAAAYTASGGIPPYTFALSGAPGLAVDANGNLRGSATTAGSFTPSLTVTDSVKATSSLALTLTVLGVTGTFPAGSTTASYSGSAMGVGGVPPYTYSASGIPPGLSFSAVGALSGQVTTPGNYSVGVQVTDSKGIGASAGFSFTITGPAPTNLTIASASLPNGFVGQAYSQTLAAAGGAPGYSWSQSGGRIPAGLSLNTSGTVLGTPTTPGSYTIGVQVSDSAGARVVGTISLNIQPAPLQLTNGAAFPAGQVGVDYPAQILVAQGGVPPYTFNVTGSLPGGLSLTNGQIAGSPATTGNYAFTLTVTDSAPMPATATLAATATINPNSPDLVLSSANIAFSFAAGATAAPAPASVPVASTTLSQILSFTASSSVPWLTVAGSTSTPGAISVALNSAALALTAAESPFAGSVLVTCTSSSCAGKSQSFAVSLNVVQTPPQLILSPTQLSFVSATSNPAPSTRNLGIVKGGAGSLNIQSVSTAAPWITIGAFPGSVLPGPGTSVAITVNPAGLNPGYYKGSVTVNTSAGAASVPVTLLLAPSALMTLAPSGAQFAVPMGGVLGDSSGSFLVSIASGSVNYRASVLQGANWLVATGSGTATPSSPGVVNFAISNSAVAALPVGPQYATIRVTGAGVVDSPQDFQVILNVTPKTTSVIPNPQPAGLLFIASGGAVNPQNINLFANSAVPIAFQATANTVSGGTWLSATPSTGTTSAESAAQISVSVSTASLQPGVYTGTVDFAFASSVRSVNVTLIVAAPHSAGSGTTQLSGLEPHATPACAGAQLVPVDTGLVSNFSAPASWPTPLAVTLFDTCGNAVGNGQLVVTFSNGDPPLALAAVDPPNGLYSATWTPQSASPQVTILANAMAQGYPGAMIQIAGQVAPNPAPAQAPNGTSDIFNPEVGAGLGPGNIVQIYGTGLAGVANTPAMLPLPTQVNGTSVIIGGETAPLFYVSPGQINAQIPFDLTPGNQYQVLVSANGALTAPQPIQLTTAVPAILQFNSGDAVAQFSDGTLVSDTSPAAPGDFLTIYLSGLGATDIQVPAGSPSPSGTLANVLDTPVLTLNGVTVPVLFAGLTPGLVGLYQIDFQVPQPLADGSYTLLITQSGTASNQTILPVKN